MLLAETISLPVPLVLNEGLLMVFPAVVVNAVLN